jgi:cytoskeletal protein CcmA (bactofilin family)
MQVSGLNSDTQEPEERISTMSMWSRRNEPEVPPRPVEPRPAVPPAAPAPPSAPASRRASTIGASVVIKGEVIAKEELTIEGEVEGAVDSQDRVTVGASGKVRAQIRAREVVIRGDVKGNVHAADRITIHKDAHLVGDVKTSGIVIEDGAYFKGSIDIVKGEAARTPGQARSEPALAQAGGR